MTPYLILPFNLKRFPDSFLLITNEAGESYFVKNHDFERFINYSLVKDETVYLDVNRHAIMTHL
jgi:hypothetical protein